MTRLSGRLSLFADGPGVHIFHNLRLEKDGDAAQIDYLILHRSGAIVIESKSVTFSVCIGERDEWMTEWNGRPTWAVQWLAMLLW